ncbi:hypothetical protein ACHAO1_005316 [Botrytis cinerea]
MAPKSLVDVLVIGAGPAGVFCAAALARLRHTAIVFSSDCAFPHVALHLARQALRLAENVTIYAHGNRALAKEIEAAKVASNLDVNSECRSKIEACNHSIQKFITNDDPSSGLTIVFDKDDGA